MAEGGGEGGGEVVDRPVKKSSVFVISRRGVKITVVDNTTVIILHSLEVSRRKQAVAMVVK